MSQEVYQDFENIKDFETPPPATFDPTKKYTWGHNDQFVLNGQEFGLILNSLRATLGTQEAQTILLANQASEALEGILAQAVATGVAKEIPSTPKNSL
jgi:hypothetical protein